MVKLEFYENLKQSLESDFFTELLLSKGDINSETRRVFIVKSLYFLISTRDFDGFEKFLSRYYKDVFPYEYLRKKTNLSDGEIKRMIYDNFIRDGFLFHITPGDNVDEILRTGLKTLNDKYKCDLYRKSLELNETYSQIRARNSELSELFKLRTLVKIPGVEQYHEDRFKTVYLSSNLDYILKTYGESGELFSFFMRDFLWAFNSSLDADFLTKDELRDRVAKIITGSGAEIYDEEVSQILDFFDTIYEEKKDGQSGNKAILLVPTNSIVSNFNYFNGLYRENRLNLSPDAILSFRDGEIGSAESIAADNIIAIDSNVDKSLCLKMKR